jgi:hypothetical protein
MPGSWAAACANTGVANAADRSAAALKIVNLVMVGFLNTLDPMRMYADLLLTRLEFVSG